MRLFAVLVAIYALSQAAIAQTPECKSILDASARLACYDKAQKLSAPTERTTTTVSLPPTAGTTAKAA